MLLLREILGANEDIPAIPHPNDDNRKLYLSFDACHIIKNVRSQLLKYDFGKFTKELYEIQRARGNLVKLVRGVTRKHVYPSNVEKMNVKRAVDIFSPAVSRALTFLETQAGKSAPVFFADAKPAIIFLQKMYKWFSIHNISDTYKHIRLADPDSKQFEDPNDERLAWLTEDFLLFIESLQFPFSKVSMFTKETIEAIKLTSHST